MEPRSQMTAKTLLEIKEHLGHCQSLLEHLTGKHAGVMDGFASLSQILQSSYAAGEGLISDDIHKIIQAVEFAAESHRGQVRKNAAGPPYIIHLIGVANMLMLEGRVRDPDVIIAGLLHDSVEDTDTTFDDIRSAFGERVEGFVHEVTDDKLLDKAQRKELQILNAPKTSAGAAQIQLCDKYYNLCDIAQDPPPGWTQERIDGYVGWGQQVVYHLPWVNASLKHMLYDFFERYWQSKRPSSDL